MAHSEVPGISPARQPDATGEPIGEGAAWPSDRAAIDWMPVVGSSQLFAEPVVRVRPRRSRAVPRRRDPDSAKPAPDGAFAGSEPIVPPRAGASSLFAVEAGSGFESASRRDS